MSVCAQRRLNARSLGRKQLLPEQSYKSDYLECSGLMKQLLLAQLKIVFWSIYGRVVWNEHGIPLPHIQHIIALLKADGTSNPPRVLDLGCGTGNYAVALAQAGFDVTGIDAASGMLAHAYAKVSVPLASHLRFQQMNVDQPLLFPDDHFDHAIAISVLQTVSDPQTTCGEVWRVMKPGGLFVVLHAPKPEYHSLPLGEEVRQRLHHLKRKTVRNVALVTLKSLVERSGGTRYWTISEVQYLLEKQHFVLQSLHKGLPIRAIAQKPCR